LKARSSGLENEWINLISGKPVQPEQLQKLDTLVTEVLKTPREVKKIANVPYANSINHSFTNQYIIEYEIPKLAREKLKSEALSEEKDETKAKALYKKKFQELRANLIRNHAINCNQPTIPPIKVKFDPKDSPFRGSAQHLKETVEEFSKLSNKELVERYLKDINKCIAQIPTSDPEFPHWDQYYLTLIKSFEKLRDEISNSYQNVQENIELDPLQKLVCKSYRILDSKKIVHITELPEFEFLEALYMKLVKVEEEMNEYKSLTTAISDKFGVTMKQFQLDMAHLTVDRVIEENPDWYIEYEDDLINSRWYKYFK
jgi:hypothetical protein